MAILILWFSQRFIHSYWYLLAIFKKYRIFVFLRDSPSFCDISIQHVYLISICTSVMTRIRHWQEMGIICSNILKQKHYLLYLRKLRLQTQGCI